MKQIKLNLPGEKDYFMQEAQNFQVNPERLLFRAEEAEQVLLLTS